jgi:succinate dehydrogenase / fumarate reductase iron-sulfur subunit
MKSIWTVAPRWCWTPCSRSRTKSIPTLTFRRSCREGVCGSCAMNIDGVNTLACTIAIGDMQGRCQGLSAAAHAGGQGPGAGSDPFLRPVRLDRAVVAVRLRHRQRRSGCNRRKTGPKWTGCTSASCAPAARPVAPAIGGTASGISGPSILLQAYRWIVDSRDEATGERLDDLEDPFRLYRCHTIMNCAKTCPKGLNPPRPSRKSRR